MRILGLDLGDKRIGVAISDPNGIFAIPLTVILRNGDEEVTKTIIDLIQCYDVERIVIGLPRSLRGNVGKQAEKVQAFITQFSRQTEVSIETWDEWLSTVASERLLMEAGTKSKQRKAQRDAVAAAFILQGYLDSRCQRDNAKI